MKDVTMKTSNKEYMPVILTAILFILSFLVFGVVRLFPNMDLVVGISLLAVIDMGFIVALIMGVKSKKAPVIAFSIIANTIFFLGVTAFIYLLMIANGISEA